MTRQLTPDEVASGYEAATGTVIVERFGEVDAARTPGVLVAGHGPFVWGPSAARSLANAVALEAIARMAHGALALGPANELEAHILGKHQERKHGADAYYGQGH